jgi:hypothetical protein
LMNAIVEEKVEPLLKLNLGCGKSKLDGYLGVDTVKFGDNVDVVQDLTKPWPWADNSVEQIQMSHVMEHFTAKERAHVVNEMWRVLVNKGTAYIITPYWCSNRAYGDMTHQWPPVSEMWYYYLWKAWRLDNAPHTDINYNPEGYNCDFDFNVNYGMHSEIMNHSSERQQFEMKWYKEAVQDLHATITANKAKPN